MTAPQRPPVASALRLDGVTKTYGKGARAVRALDGVSLAVPRGAFTAVMGPSGSGKSTLLQCAAGLDRPTGGTVHLGDRRLDGLGETALAKLRRTRIGFVFQSYNLVPALSVAKNVTLPLRLAGVRARKSEVRSMLELVGLADRAHDRPARLSGGQQQRVAIARALMTRPDVIFADEPTGALDLRTGAEILSLLRGLVDQTVVMVTHDAVAAGYADTVVFLADGRIVDTMAAPTADAVSDRMTRLGAWA